MKPRQSLRVTHAMGEKVHDTDVFQADDKSSPGVLVVFSRENPARPIATYNREFWIVAELFDPNEEVDDGQGEVRAEAERAVRGS